VGARFACAVNSCTAALHLGLEAMGVGAAPVECASLSPAANSTGHGDKVLVQSMTFTASAEVVRYLGADPVFLDCDPQTRLITPEIVEAAVRQHPDAKALVVVHFGGQAAQMLDENGRPGLLSVCRKHGLKILEDAAHAFPAYVRCGQKSEVSSQRSDGGERRAIGSMGDVTCFSFYANKTITTGEGGMLVTDDESVWQRVKAMRLHGINRDIWDRYTKGASWEYDVIAPGYKYNMPDVNAAIGLAQLERADEMRQARQRCAEFYFEALKDIDCIDLPTVLVPMEDHAWHLFCIVLKPEAPLRRNDFIEKMAQAGIGTSVHYKPLHRMTYYRERYRLRPEDFPNTERIWQGTVSLPIYPSLSEAELEYIVATIRGLLC